VRRRMKAELGAQWESKFQSFSREAVAAASLGQVHQAINHDNQTLACKLQYPDMQSAISGDLSQLKLIFSLYERYDPSFKTGNVHAELSARLYEELDYTLEARHTRLYADILCGESNVHVPDVIDDLSTPRLLTTSWMEGQGILSFKESSLEVRNQIAMNMFRAWYVPLYHYGVIHGDPHLGNYTVRDDHGINLLDFGCVRVFPAKFVQGVIDLYNALLQDDRALAVHAYETWGFEGLSNDLIDTLNIWANFLYGPIMDDQVRPIGELTNGVYGRDIAQKVHAELRKSSAGIKMPREFVFMDRAALGLGSVFLHLNAQMNWYKAFQELIKDFDQETLEKRQSSMLRSHDLL